MNVLITGGAGSVGRDLCAAFVEEGHRVKVLDKRAEALPRKDRNLEVIAGAVEDRARVTRALEGVDTVIHLAWSFSDDPAELVEIDLKGHVGLLEACAAAKVSRFFYASSAVVYGKPVEVPVTEDQPCRAEDSRKPFYAAAKIAAEKLALAYWKTKGLPVVVLRFWWSFGAQIGGRHLRDMVKRARAGEPLAVPEGAGGSFLDHDDLARALRLAARQDAGVGQTFNLATLYLEWKDIARMILEVTGSSSRLDVVPAGEWQGAAFLADAWELSTARAGRLLGYRSGFGPAVARERLRRAIAAGLKGNS